MYITPQFTSPRLSVPFQTVRAGVSGTFRTVPSSDYFKV